MNADNYDPILENEMREFGRAAMGDASAGRSPFGQFAKRMRERLMSRMEKYGPLEASYPEKVHAFNSALARMDAYIETGNTQYLIDAANFMYIEFEFSSHPEAHFDPEMAEDEPLGRVIRADVGSEINPTA